MRRKEQEISEIDAIEKIIGEATVCRLGLCEGERPYIVPMSFGYQDKKLYFHSAKAGKKIDMIKANPHVCFEFDIDLGLNRNAIACNWGANYKSVIGWGKARFIEDIGEKTDALDIIMSQYSDEKHTFSQASIDSTLVFVVEIEELSGKRSS